MSKQKRYYDKMMKDPDYRQKRREESKRWIEANPEKAKRHQHKSRWKRAYPNGTDAQYEHYLNATHCECCGVEFEDNTIRSKCQDHDHDTGKLRRVICNGCNCAEGYNQTPERAYQVACYMASNKSIFELIGALHET